MTEEPRARDGRAPDIFTRGGWVPMRQHREDEAADFVIVGAGAGGLTLAAKLAEAGFTVLVLEAGPYWRPLEDFASDEAEQHKLYWRDRRITGGDDPIELGGNNSGRGVGGSTVHFSMNSLRFRPEWFRSRSALGYGVDWPISYAEIRPYYVEAERALAVSGPVRYPWGPLRGPYPYRPHEVNAAGLVLARGAEALGVKWAPTPIATVSAPRGKSSPCMYRGWCNFGCSTNAKQSALVVWAPRALAAGAEIRDLAMATRIEVGGAGLVTGVHYRREGRDRFQQARHVVVAGYAIETPRLLLNSACPQHPNGLANSSGLVGRNLMTHASPTVWATFDEEIRSYKAPPNMAVCEHWNYVDEGKDFHGGYAFMSQGPHPMAWAEIVATARDGMWGWRLREEMLKYNRTAGLAPVGESEPREVNRVELAEETDQFGLPIPRVVFSYSDNDRRLQAHALRFMSRMLEAAGGRDLWTNDDTSHILGTCRMGDDPRRSVVDADGRSWDIRNLWICDGSLFPTSGGVNPSLTIQALACRIGDRIARMARRGELAAAAVG